jgi:peptide/nickel transport system ATP-binding protein/peptide/nickel transport system permease protein
MTSSEFDLTTPSGSPSALSAEKQRKPRLRVSSSQIAAVIGALLILGLAAVAVFADRLSPYDPTERIGLPFEEPNSEYRLGTNDIGQDIFSELIYGTRVSLIVGFASALVAITIGTSVGMLSGYYERLDSLLMRVVDIVLVIPFLPLLILLAAYLGRSLVNTVFIIGLLLWAGTARVIRSQVLTISKQEYVLAARAVGANDRHIIFRHILPQVSLLAIGQFVQVVSTAILLEAALSFLGLGDPITKSWGSVLYWAQVRGAFLTPAWLWWVLPPGLLIVFSSVGFAMIGFSLEQRVDPRLKQSR